MLWHQIFWISRPILDSVQELTARLLQRERALLTRPSERHSLFVADLNNDEDYFLISQMPAERQQPLRPDSQRSAPLPQPRQS